ncbi:MAG TPA: hypothetical protein VH144_02610 [Candidatus Saccharimonadales bacterium]|jgi:hypothetical protein|nr:hypothetical protein [Candidatus Saccharimonadales bacterium]
MKRLSLVFCLVLLVGICLFGLASSVSASPFGQGKFGANVPFGSATSISINVGSDVPLTLTPSGGNFSGTGSHTVTVTSTDVVGYYLYAHTNGSSNMTNGSATIPASSNSTLLPLSVGSWGYNTTGSTTNFLGMLSSSSLLTDGTGPFTSGDPTTVTYGALVNNVQAAGSYSVNVVYTAVAKNP